MLTESREVEFNTDVKYSQITELKKGKSQESLENLKTFMQVTLYEQVIFRNIYVYTNANMDAVN